LKVFGNSLCWIIKDYLIWYGMLYNKKEEKATFPAPAPNPIQIYQPVTHVYVYVYIAFPSMLITCRP